MICSSLNGLVLSTSGSDIVTSFPIHFFFEQFFICTKNQHSYAVFLLFLPSPRSHTNGFVDSFMFCACYDFSHRYLLCCLFVFRHALILFAQLVRMDTLSHVLYTTSHFYTCFLSFALGCPIIPMQFLSCDMYCTITHPSTPNYTFNHHPLVHLLRLLCVSRFVSIFEEISVRRLRHGYGGDVASQLQSRDPTTTRWYTVLHVRLQTVRRILTTSTPAKPEKRCLKMLQH